MGDLPHTYVGASPGAYVGGGRVPPRVCGCEGVRDLPPCPPGPVHPGGLPPFHPGDKGMGKTRKGIGQDEWTCRCHWKESQPEIHGKTDGPEKPIDQVEIPSLRRRCCQGADRSNKDNRYQAGHLQIGNQPLDARTARNTLQDEKRRDRKLSVGAIRTCWDNK